MSLPSRVGFLRGLTAAPPIVTDGPKPRRSPSRATQRCENPGERCRGLVRHSCLSPCASTPFSMCAPHACRLFLSDVHVWQDPSSCPCGSERARRTSGSSSTKPGRRLLASCSSTRWILSPGGAVVRAGVVGAVTSETGEMGVSAYLFRRMCDLRCLVSVGVTAQLWTETHVCGSVANVQHRWWLLHFCLPALK